MKTQLDKRPHLRANALKRRVAATTGVGISFLLILTGCAVGESSPTPSENVEIQEGGILNIGLSGDPGILDPTFANTLTSVSVFNSMCELLYNVNSDGVVFPQLAAEAPTFSADNSSATIPLRKNVLFADGTPMDADAVKFSLDRHMTSKGSQRTNELGAVKEVSVVDDSTIELTFKQPIAPGAFDVVLTDRAGTIVSPTAAKELGDEFGTAPVCVGPFKYVSRIAQDSVTLERDPGYYDADKVHLDGIVYRVIPDTSVRATNLRSGDLDAMERVATTDLGTLESDSKISVEKFAGLGFLNLIFNVGNSDGVTNPPGVVDTPLAKDKRIRQAFEMSIDRDAINAAVFSGAYEPACGFMAPSSPLATKQTLSCNEYNPDAAKKLLAETGVQTPLQVEFLSTNIPEYRRLGEVLQQMVAETGFDLVLNLNESTATVDLSYSGNFQMYLNSWSGRIDPDANISQFTMSNSPRSVGKFNNAKADKLIVDARSAGDAQERKDAYDALDKILKDEVPFIFLIRPVNLIGYSTNVSGLEFRPNGGIVPTHAGFIAEK